MSILPKKVIQKNNFILYIDATQKQVFENYVKFVKSFSLKSDAIKREKYIMQNYCHVYLPEEITSKIMLDSIILLKNDIFSI